MVEYVRRGSSGVAKAGLTTGIVGASLALLNGGLNGLTGGGAPFFGGGHHNHDLALIQQNYTQSATIAKLESEKYADACTANAMAAVYAELKEQNKEICELKAGLAMETERRACGDERLLTYVNGNYIKAEKGLNSKVINWHGCRPAIEPKSDCCCEEPA